MIEGRELPTTRWVYPDEQASVYDEISQDLSVGAIVARALVNRGIDTVEKGRKFISISLGDMHNPNLMRDMEKGVARVVRAVKNNEKITAYGDYDADGVTSVVLLMLFLKKVNAAIDYYIPDRTNEGYGLNRAVLTKLRSQGTTLLITVDCGVSDCEDIAFAGSIGMDVIVIDHHEVPPQLPPAHAVINPMRADCRFPFKYLAAVGIVFNFIVALRGAMRTEGFWSDYQYPNLKEYLDLVAIGTIGDTVPLVDENRIFVKIGMELMTAQKRIGVRALKEVAGLDKQPVDISKSSYIIIPRINAAGRIATSDDAVDLFLTDDISKARALAQKLDSHNRRRQDIERSILKDIIYEIEKMGDIDNTNSFVFASENWHPGVIGVVASRIVSRFLRPAFLISLKDGVGKGSGRSVADIDIYQSLKRCGSLLLSFGGHRNAAGISIKEKNIEKFSELIEEFVSNSAGIGDFTAQTLIDADCLLSDINSDLVSQLNLLAPFGTSNPEPVLCVKDVHATAATVVGNNHLKMRVNASDGASIESIWYGKGGFLRDVSKGAFAVAFCPQFNTWKGQNAIQLRLLDIAPAWAT